MGTYPPGSLPPSSALGCMRSWVRGVRQKASSDRKSTRLNSSHSQISYAVFCLKKKKQTDAEQQILLTNINHRGGIHAGSTTVSRSHNLTRTCMANIRPWLT